MPTIAGRIALLVALAWPLAACGLADSRSVLPEILRVKETDAAAPEPAPDVKHVVSVDLEVIFVATSAPHDVRVSAPHRELQGSGWTACVKAELTSAMGGALGSQTYRVVIADGHVVDRRRVGAEDNCALEHYVPI